MSFETDPTRTTRRDFLRHAALGVAGVTLLPLQNAFGQEAAQKTPYDPFRMAVQSYSLRHYHTDEALAKTKDLGLHWWEAFPQHFEMTSDAAKLDEYKAKLKANGIRLSTYGVVDFSKDEADARKKFDFAKAMGIRTLSAYPTADSFDLLDKLVEEYRINIAIHNHGPGDDRYDKIEKGLKAIEGHNPRIGACIDTGHYLRSNEDPVEAAVKFGKRVYGVHLKDVKNGPNGEKQFTEIGKGNLDTVKLLQTLHTNGYRRLVSLEYEEHEENPISFMEECLAATREAIKKALA